MKTCETCKYWERHYRSKLSASSKKIYYDTGSCGLFGVNEWREIDFESKVGFEELSTPIDFGCIHHKEK